jgi:hypothetical protein
MNTLTRNVLIHYDAALTDEQTILRVMQDSGTSPYPATRGASSTHSAGRNMMNGPPPDPIRTVIPVLHLVYSCSPVGVGMHVSELAWAIGWSKGPIRIALPVLHLVLACSPAGIALHVGELAWALAPFLAPDRRQERLLRSVPR